MRDRLESIEKLNLGLGGVGELMQIVDDDNITFSALRKVGVLIQSVTYEVDKKLSEIED